MTAQKPKCVLIVDDEEDIRSILAFEFEMKGIEVLDAEGVSSALEIAKGKTIDLLISDVRMPQRNGTELLEQMASSVPNIIMISGYTDLTPEEAVKKGAQKLVAKPFDVGQFVDELFVTP